MFCPSFDTRIAPLLRKFTLCPVSLHTFGIRWFSKENHKVVNQRTMTVLMYVWVNGRKETVLPYAPTPNRNFPDFLYKMGATEQLFFIRPEFSQSVWILLGKWANRKKFSIGAQNPCIFCLMTPLVWANRKKFSTGDQNLCIYCIVTSLVWAHGEKSSPSAQNHRICCLTRG